MAHEAIARLELEDIQSGLILARPSPYAAAYLMFRIDDGKAGRELMRRAGTVVASAADSRSPLGGAWATVALTFQGLRHWACHRILWIASHLNSSRGWRQGRAS